VEAEKERGRSVRDASKCGRCSERSMVDVGKAVL
jgi:hypothetical protein